MSRTIRCCVLLVVVVVAVVAAATVRIAEAATVPVSGSPWFYGSFLRNGNVAFPGMPCQGGAVWQYPAVQLDSSITYTFKVNVSGSSYGKNGMQNGAAVNFSPPFGASTVFLAFYPQGPVLNVSTVPLCGVDPTAVTFSGNFNSWGASYGFQCPETSISQFLVNSLQPGQQSRFKVRVGELWFGQNNTLNGVDDDIPFTVGSTGRVYLWFDAARLQVVVSSTAMCVIQGTPYFVGSFNNWDVTALPGHRCLSADNTYFAIVPFISPGEYQWKVALGPTWSNGDLGQNGVFNGNNLVLNMPQSLPMTLLVVDYNTLVPSATIDLSCFNGTMGDMGFYVFEVIAMVAHFIVLVLAVWQARQHYVSKDMGYGLRVLALVAVAIFNGIRFIDNFLHVIREYVFIPNGLKHILFVVPFAFVFTCYSLVVYFWYRIAASVRTAAPASVKWAFIGGNALIYGIVIAIVIAYFEYQGSADQFRVIGASNCVLAAVFLVAIVCFVVFGGRVTQLLVAASKVQSSSKGTTRRPLAKIASLTVTCTVCFAVFASLLAYEGSFLFEKFTFVAADGEYTTTPLLQWIQFLTLLLPPMSVVAVLWRPTRETTSRRTGYQPAKSQSSMSTPAPAPLQGRATEMVNNPLNGKV